METSFLSDQRTNPAVRDEMSTNYLQTNLELNFFAIRHFAMISESPKVSEPGLEIVER